MKKRVVTQLTPESPAPSKQLRRKTCDSCEQYVSICFCFSCEGYLCQNCDQQLHNNKLTRSHQRVSDFDPVRCSTHQKFVTQVCAECQALVCVSCVAEAHRGHQIQQLVESYEIVQGEVSKALQVMSQKLGVVARVDESLQGQKKQLTETVNSVKQSLEENFSIVIEQLKQKQTEIMERVQQFERSNATDIDEKLNIVQSLGKRLATQRKNMIRAAEETVGLQQDSNDQIYLQKLAKYVKSFIDNQEEIMELQEENSQLEGVLTQLDGELEVPQQFCLDFDSVQQFLESIEGLYMCVQKLGE